MTTGVPPTRKPRIQRWLSVRRLPLWLAALVLILTLPSVFNGYQADDFLHHEMLRHPGAYGMEEPRLGSGMFTFVDGNPARTRTRINRGELPWWTSEHLRIAFFRPLTELTHVVDHRLWPNGPRRMHVHSLLWYSALVLAATLLYRRVSTPIWVAGLAAFLYAVDDSHGIPVGWLANRNSIVAAFFGVLTIIFHIRWRRDCWRPGRVLGPVGLACGLLASEAAVAIGAYILAYEATLAHGRLRARMRALSPYVILGIGWWIAYRALEYGATGSGAYLNPGRDPLLFARALLERVPVLLCGQWLFPDADLYAYLSKPDAYVFLAAAVAAVGVLGIVLYPLLRRDPTARFWGLGMLLSLVPVCATFPTNRLLIFVGLGTMGLMAQFLAGWFTRADWLPSARAWRGLARVLAILLVLDHAVGATLRLPSTSTQLARFTRFYLETPLVEMSEEGTHSGKTVFFLNPATAITVVLIPYIRTGLDAYLPEHTHVLSSGLHEYIEITRVDDRTLEIAPQDGFASAGIDRIFRSAGDPMRPGQRVELDAMTVEVLSTMRDGRPRRARFTFADPLESSSYLFIEHHADGMAPFTLPAVGETVRLPWSMRLTF